MRPRDDKRAEAMYSLYQKGFTLEEIGKAFSIRLQSVHGMFTRRRWTIRNRGDALPYIVFDDVKYTLRKTGYYASTSRPRTLLHRAIWMKHHGEIPPGHDVHHCDEDRTNNRLDNLKLLKSGSHTGHHNANRAAKGMLTASQLAWKHGKSPAGNRRKSVAQ